MHTKTLTFRQFRLRAVREDQQSNDLDHFFASKFGVFAGYVLHRLGLTPNQATSLFIALGVLGAIFNALDLLFVGYVFWRLHIVVDIADGSIARATEKYSTLGPLLDKLGHQLIYPCVFAGLVVGPMRDLSKELSILLFVVFITQWGLKYMQPNRKFLSTGGSPSIRLFKRAAINCLGLEGLMIVLMLQSILLVSQQEIAWGFIASFAFLGVCKLLKILRNVDK